MNQSDVTYAEKLNELRLDISHPRNERMVFVLLEGQSDIRLFRKLFNLSFCKVERVPGGNPKLEECVETLLEQHNLMFGIRDADFLRILESAFDKEGIFLTDAHDIELTMLSLDSISSTIFHEMTDIPVLQHGEIIMNLYQLLRPTSILKLINSRDTIGLNFSCSFIDYVSADVSSFNRDGYFEHIVQCSTQSNPPSVTELIDLHDELQGHDYEFAQLTNGHDFLRILAAYFRTHPGNKSVSEAHLSSSLRMLFGPNCFKKTELYNLIEEWQNNHNVTILL